MTRKATFTTIFIFINGLIILNWACADKKFYIKLTADKTTVSPYEIVTITTKTYTFIKDRYEASIGDENVFLIKNNENKLLFMMPEIPKGKQTLSFLVEGEKQYIDFTITEIKPISYPETKINEYITELKNMLSTLKYFNTIESHNISSQNIQIVENYISDFEQAIPNTTIKEKLKIAQILIKYPEIFKLNMFDFSIINDDLQTGTKNSVKWDKQFTKDAQYFINLVKGITATVPIFKEISHTETPVAIEAATNAYTSIKFLLILDLTETILKNSYVPYEFSIVNIKTKELNFINNKEKNINITATYRSLQNSDIGQGTSSTVNDISISMNTFAEYWNDIVSYFPKISGTVNTLEDQNYYTTNSNSSSISTEYITIKNISNSNVTVSRFSNYNDKIYVTFTTIESEEQDFTFDIVYKNTNFITEIITVNASLTCECSTYMLDGYEVVDIGSQTWMTQNMVEPSGTYLESDDDWANLYDPDDDNSDGIITTEPDLAGYYCYGLYGYLYTWEAAKNVCPTGWHLPTDTEWNELINYLGGSSVAGGKLKEAGTLRWRSPNTGATNESCFTALPSGYRREMFGYFWGSSSMGFWWEATESVYNSNDAYFRRLDYGYSSIGIQSYPKWNGMSVRCIKD